MRLERRRSLAAAGPESGGLPSEYQRCEWIRNDSGTPYLQTVQVENNSWPLSIQVGFYATAIAMYSGFVCQIGTNAGSYNKAGVVTKGNVGFRQGGDNYLTASGDVKNKRVDAVVEYTASGASISADVAGTTYTKASESASPTSWPDRYFYVFCTASNNKMTGRVYYAQVYQNGRAVADLVPCYRKADEVTGMYDLVSGTFFSNAAGDGAFSKGADVT